MRGRPGLVLINSDVLVRLKQAALDLHRHGRGLLAAAKTIKDVERDDGGDAGQDRDEKECR